MFTCSYDVIRRQPVQCSTVLLFVGNRAGESKVHRQQIWNQVDLLPSALIISPSYVFLHDRADRSAVVFLLLLGGLLPNKPCKFGKFPCDNEGSRIEQWPPWLALVSTKSSLSCLTECVSRVALDNLRYLWPAHICACKNAQFTNILFYWCTIYGSINLLSVCAPRKHFVRRWTSSL